jgi:hypothetical protein
MSAVRIMPALTHRAIRKLDLTASLGEFVAQEHVMDIVAGPRRGMAAPGSAGPADDPA